MVEVIPVQEYLWRALPKRTAATLWDIPSKACAGDYYALAVGPGSEVPLRLRRCCRKPPR